MKWEGKEEGRKESVNEWDAEMEWPKVVTAKYGVEGTTGNTGGFFFWGGEQGPCPQDAKTPGCYIAMYVFGVSILGAFGVLAQFDPSNFTV